MATQAQLSAISIPQLPGNEPKDLAKHRPPLIVYRKRKLAMAMLSEGLEASNVENVLGKKFQGKPKNEKDKAAVDALRLKAERAHPKSTARNPLYQNFGKKKDGTAGTADYIVPSMRKVYYTAYLPCLRSYKLAELLALPMWKVETARSKCSISGTQQAPH